MSSSISQEPITIVDLPSFLPSWFGPVAAAGPSRTSSSSCCYCRHSPSFSRQTISFDLKRPSSKLQSFCNEFNRFVRTHCEWAPIGPPAAGRFASAGVSGEETPIEDDGPGIVEDDGAPLNGVGIEPAAKKVLILMSDTGGGHRALAEAIKASFNQEFGDEYQRGCQRTDEIQARYYYQRTSSEFVGGIKSLPIDYLQLTGRYL